MDLLKLNKWFQCLRNFKIYKTPRYLIIKSGCFSLYFTPTGKQKEYVYDGYGSNVNHIEGEDEK